MTRLKGAGSLAHEYGHSIDNYISRLNGYDENGLASEQFNYQLRNLPENVKNAFDEVVDSIMYNTSTNEEELAKKNAIFEKNRIENLEYYLKTIDDIFNGKGTTYKRNRKTREYERIPIEVTNEQAQKYKKIRETLIKGEVNGDVQYDFANTYSLNAKRTYPEPISTLQDLYKEVVGRKIDDDTIHSVYMRSKPAQQVTSIKSESAYYKSARELDALTGRKSSYYATKPEMIARAFESYVFDKLQAKGITDNYLVHSTNNDAYALFNPFPAGEERTKINKAFDKLIKAMKDEGFYNQREETRHSVNTTPKATDSQGRTLSKQQQEYFKDSKVRDENGNLVKVYHTTTDNITQFNEFNPVGTKGYRFGNQVVNYYTDSKDMSGSYANDIYEMADTKKLNTLDEAKQWLESQNGALNNYEIKENNGRFTILNNGSVFGNIGFENEQDLLRNLKSKFNEYRENSLGKRKNKIQYQGYIKITNPYVVDAEGRNWNNVDYESNEEIDDVINTINNIPDSFYEEIKNIYNEEKNKLNNATEQLQELNSYIEAHADNDFINKINKITILETIQQSDALQNNRDLTESNTTTTSKNIIKQVANTDNLEEALNYVNKKLKEQSGYNNLSIGQLIEKQRDLISADRSKYSVDTFDDVLEEYFESNNDVAEQFENLENYLDFDDNLTEIIKASITENTNIKDYLKAKFVNDMSEENFTTNDIVKQIIKSNKSGETNYDGVIVKNVYDYGGESKGTLKPANVYVTFNSNQFKADDNLNPTYDDDLRYSNNLSFDEYLEKRLGKTGTRTRIGDIIEKKKAVLPEKRISINDFTDVVNEYNLPDKEKSELLSGLEGIELNEEALEDFKGYVKEFNKAYKETQKIQQEKIIQKQKEVAEAKQDRFKEKAYNDKDRAKLISKKIAEFNKNMEYDDSIPTEIDNVLPKNRNGKRTVKDIKENFAKELGKRLVQQGYSDEQIEDIAVKSYLDFQPQKNITKYDNKQKRSVGYEPLRLNDWINSVYEGVREEQRYSIDTSAENTKTNEKVEKVEQSKLPQREKSELRKEYDKVQKNIIKGKETEINNLIKAKNENSRMLEAKISDKQKQYNELKNKTTKKANNLLIQAENLKQQKNKVENEYNKRITTKETRLDADKIKQQTRKELKLTRAEIRQKLLDDMRITEQDLEVGKDIKALNYQLTDPVRVNEKVFGRELGKKINDATINQTKHNTAEKTRWLNKERSEIAELGIKARSKESEAVQKYAEKKWFDEKGNEHKYGDEELAQDFPNVETQNKIKKASNVLRAKYDTYLEELNNVLTAMGYDEIPKREDYMMHFQELTDKLSMTGIPFNRNDMSADLLPTDINGLTEFNRPR